VSPTRPEPTQVEQRALLHARWEAVESVRAQELAALTEEQALRVIETLSAAEVWRERNDWSGLVEQQAHFTRSRLR
jgi:hypothetical protein